MPVFGDVRRLIEYSLIHPLSSALSAFPMFPREQIKALYAVSPAKRRRFLSADSPEGIAHYLQRFDYHRNPAQVEKMRDQAIDPSNR